jgi:hypothetical protein
VSQPTSRADLRRAPRSPSRCHPTSFVA